MGKVWKVRAKLAKLNNWRWISVIDKRKLIPRMRKIKKHRRIHRSDQIMFINRTQVRRIVRAGRPGMRGRIRYAYWPDGRWFDVPFRVPFYHFTKRLQRLRIQNKLKKRRLFFTKRHLFLSLVLRFTKRLKIRKVFQIWKKLISRKFAKRVMKSTGWKLRRHKYKTIYRHWKNYTDHNLKKKIALKLFILAPIRGVVIGFAKHIEQYHVNLLKYQFITERLLFIRMLLENKDLIYHKKTGKSVLTYKHRFDKFKLKMINRFQILQNLFIFIRMHQSITMHDDPSKYLHMRLFEVHHKRDNLMQNEILYYLVLKFGILTK